MEVSARIGESKKGKTVAASDLTTMTSLGGDKKTELVEASI